MDAWRREAMRMRQVAKSWEVIEGVLWENSHSVFRALRPPATPKQIAALQRAIPARLPAPLTRSLGIHDGLRRSYLGPIRLFDYMALLPATKIAHVWQMRCRVHG